MAVISGSPKASLFCLSGGGAVANSLQKRVKFLSIVRNGEYICQDLTFQAEDNAAMFALGNVNFGTNHDEYP